MRTAVGAVAVTRRYVTCPQCGEAEFRGDRVLGIDGGLTRAAERMASLAGVRDSFARAEQLLRELAGWELDAETIRRCTHAAAARAMTTRPTRGGAARFAATGGDTEVQIDAGKVNTQDGWRDVKVAVFARRERAAAATPAEWGQRDLPAPHARTVVAGVEDAATFESRVRAEADRLGVTTAPDVSVLGDGAEWLWNVADDVVPQAAGVLDIYHAVEHIATAVKAVWGETTPTAAARIDAGRAALLAGGKAGIEHWIGAVLADVPAETLPDPLLALAAYFAKHPTRLNYAARLQEGRAIGSGLIEGTIKQIVNRRLKITGARWRTAHVAPLVELAALVDTPDWQDFWTAA